MTVSSTSSRVVYNGDGSRTVWGFNFKIQQAADLVVVYTDATGTDFTLSPSQYSAAGFASDMGGTVTYPLGGSPIAVGTQLTILRSVSPTQPTSISNQGAMWPAVIEAALDRLTFIAQGFLDAASRALTISPSDGGPLQPLPNRTQRASSFLAFDVNGQPIAAAGVSGTSIAAAMVAVVQSASLSAARSVLGCLGLADNNAPSGNMTPSAGTWDLTGATAVRVATRSAGDNSTNAASTSYVDRVNPFGRRAVADTNTTIASTDRIVAYTSLTASRTISLPAASTMMPGQRLTIVDESGQASASRQLSLAPNGTDKIAGSNTTQVIVNLPFGRCELACDGAGAWFVIGSWSVAYSANLASDVVMNASATYFDGPSVAQGTVGTWEVGGTVTVTDPVGAQATTYRVKLHDGTTVFKSLATVEAAVAQQLTSASFANVVVSAPAGNLRISVRDDATANSKILASFTGLGSDSHITAKRLT